VAARIKPIATAILLGVAACGGGSSQGSSKPFIANGGIEAGAGSGLWGDAGSGPNGMQIGCVTGRHYALLVTMRNRSNAAVTLTSARGPDPAPTIIRRVAVQFRLAAPSSNARVFVTNLRRWSAAPAVPVTIPPGRSAAVQSNLLMGHCKELGPSRTLVVNGSLVLSYRASGHAHQQEVAQRSARIILSRGPTVRRCTPVPRSARLVAADIACTVARRAALGCRREPHGTWGTCSAAGHIWNCTATAPAGRRSLESCWLASKSQWFKVSWTE
jgi:hypothetical protein